MNENSFSRRPEDVQQIILEVGRGYGQAAGASLNGAQQRGLVGFEEGGATIKEISPEIRASRAASLSRFPDEMAKDADGRGMPGSTVRALYLQAVSDAGYE